MGNCCAFTPIPSVPPPFTPKFAPVPARVRAPVFTAPPSLPDWKQVVIKHALQPMVDMLDPRCKMEHSYWASDQRDLLLTVDKTTPAVASYLVHPGTPLTPAQRALAWCGILLTGRFQGFVPLWDGFTEVGKVLRATLGDMKTLSRILPAHLGKFYLVVCMVHRAKGSMINGADLEELLEGAIRARMFNHVSMAPWMCVAAYCDRVDLVARVASVDTTPAAILGPIVSKVCEELKHWSHLPFLRAVLTAKSRSEATALARSMSQSTKWMFLMDTVVLLHTYTSFRERSFSMRSRVFDLADKREIHTACGILGIRAVHLPGTWVLFELDALRYVGRVVRLTFWCCDTKVDAIPKNYEPLRYRMEDVRKAGQRTGSEFCTIRPSQVVREVEV